MCRKTSFLDENSVFLSLVMKALYLFNPENDMALASGSPYYMLPASIKKMAEDLSALPAWYAPAEADVLLADKRQVSWIQEEFGCLLDVGLASELSPIYNKVYPWGWNASLIRRLKEGGVGECALIPDDRMQEIRHLSGRWTSVEMLPRLRVDGTMGESFLVGSLENVKAFLAKREGDFSKREGVLLKSPWSGSGKGIRMVLDGLDDSALGWVKRVISSQGSIVVEPHYDKVVDFAMEFYSDGKGIRFVGYSLFETDKRGIYKGNVLASDEDIERRLSAYVPAACLRVVRERCLKELGNAFLDKYTGYLGVDMMVCRQDEGYAVHPCVEINLRMNMGVVSRLLYDKFLCRESQGTYLMEFYPKPGEALSFHREMKEAYPLRLELGRIRNGYLSLTPVFEDTSYQIFVLLK